jgi:hypothetical protein
MRAPLVFTHVVPLVLVMLGSAASCRRSRDLNGVSEPTFVAVMADLKRLRDKPGLDSGRRAFLRDSILQSRDLKAAQLEKAASQLAQNPARAQTVWQAIERRANDTLTTRPPAPPSAK